MKKKSQKEVLKAIEEKEELTDKEKFVKAAKETRAKLNDEKESKQCISCDSHLNQYSSQPSGGALMPFYWCPKELCMRYGLLTAVYRTVMPKIKPKVEVGDHKSGGSEKNVDPAKKLKETK